MKKKPGDPFAPDTICDILKERNLISPLQEKNNPGKKARG